MRNIISILSLSILLIVASSCGSKSDKRDAAKNNLYRQIADNQSKKAQKPTDLEFKKETKIITDANFEQYLSNGVTLIDFWADWCKPCKMQAPIVDQLAQEYGDRMYVGKMDVDNNQNIPRQFQVQNIPTILIFKDGKQVDRVVGLNDYQTLAAKIEMHL
jgi:thioredoxin 1